MSCMMLSKLWSGQAHRMKSHSAWHCQNLCTHIACKETWIHIWNITDSCHRAVLLDSSFSIFDHLLTPSVSHVWREKPTHCLRGCKSAGSFHAEGRGKTRTHGCQGEQLSTEEAASNPTGTEKRGQDQECSLIGMFWYDTLQLLIYGGVGHHQCCAFYPWCLAGR